MQKMNTKSCIWKYPETSVGWYRRKFYIAAEDSGKHIAVRFDGIFRNAQVFCNGFYLGHEPSGYATQVYDLTEYLNYGAENLLTVRVDASTEEGWYYEGAGIYRDVWLEKMSLVHVAPFGTFVTSHITDSYKAADVNIEVRLSNIKVRWNIFQIHTYSKTWHFLFSWNTRQPNIILDFTGESTLQAIVITFIYAPVPSFWKPVHRPILSRK